MRIIRQWLIDTERTAKQDILSLLALFGVVFFETLGRIPLIEPDEGRYAEIPREMLERSDFVTPYLNYVKYFEKPPLHYWLNAFSMSIFGQNEFAARFAGTLMGLLTVLLTYHLGRKLFDRRTGLLSAIIIGTCTGFLIQARLNFTDMTLTCTLSAALGFFIVAAREGEQRKALYYHLAYVCAALAVLAKGLIGIVFPGAIVFIYLLLTRRWRLLREMRLPTGIPLFLLVAAPWFILVSLRNPEFARFFFIHEHFERFTSKVHGRYQPIWFFIPVLIGTMLPWSFLIPAAVRGAWRDRRSEKGNARLYLVIWAAFIFLFFSKSDSKLIPYILPVFPALAVLLGHAFSTVLDGDFKPLRIQASLAGGVLCVVGAGVVLYPHLASGADISKFSGALAGGLFLLQGLCVLGAVARRNALALFIAFACFSYILECVLPSLVLPGIVEGKSSKELALKVAQIAPKEAAIISFGIEQGLSFYTGRRIIVFGDRNELEFGSRQGDQSAWFIDITRYPDLLALWRTERPVFFLLSEVEYAYLKSSIPLPVTVLGRNKRKILLTNR
jgi:4-amino-4-deoxy-L-arabinose transferase-like glycosyltransferase